MKKLILCGLMAFSLSVTGCNNTTKPSAVVVIEKTKEVDSLKHKIFIDSLNKSEQVKVDKMLAYLSKAIEFESKGKIDSGKKYRQMILDLNKN